MSAPDIFDFSIMADWRVEDAFLSCPAPHCLWQLSVSWAGGSLGALLVFAADHIATVHEAAGTTTA